MNRHFSSFSFSIFYRLTFALQTFSEATTTSVDLLLSVLSLVFDTIGLTTFYSPSSLERQGSAKSCSLFWASIFKFAVLVCHVAEFN